MSSLTRILHWRGMAESFSVTFDGPAVEDHTIDASVLAHALLSLSGLLEATHDAVTPDAGRFAVRVQSSEESSFKVWLEYAGMMMTLLHSENATALANLNALFGRDGLIPLLKWASGRPLDRIDHKDGRSIVTINEETREFSFTAGQLAINRNVRRNVRRFVGDALKAPGLDTVRIEIPHEPTIEIKQAEAAPLTLPTGEDLIFDDVVQMELKAETIRFRTYKWELRDVSTGAFIRASIDDPAYRQAIDNNEVRHGRGDILLCEVRIRQWEEDSGEIRTERSIERVLDVFPGADPDIGQSELGV